MLSRKFILNPLLSLLTAGVTFIFAQTAQADSLHLVSQQQVVKNQNAPSLDWLGVYQGNLPCANCSEIQITLTLQPNGQYQQVSDYIGNNGGVFVTKGKFHWDVEAQTIQLFENGKLQTQYALSNNQLKQLDGKGQPLSGPLASLYVLSKK